MNLVAKVNQFIATHQLSHKPFVVGLSGGIDSVVLLDLLVKSDIPNQNIKAVHVNHGLSQHANDWQLFCQSLCNDYGVSYQAEKVLVTSSKLGIEGEARRLRYDALSSHVNNDCVLATAQHLDDQAETLLLALKRGSGVLGLAGMMPVMPFKDGLHARPLLDISQVDVEKWAKQNKLKWVEDESNTDEQFDRNYLRHSVMKELNQRWPSFSRNVSRTAQLCQEQMELADEIASDDLARQDCSKQQLALSLLDELSPARRNNLVRYWLRINSVSLPSQKQLAQLIKQTQSKDDAQVKIELGEVVIRRFQQRLYIVDKSCETLPLKIVIEDIRDPEPITTPLGQVILNDCSGALVIKLPSKDSKITLEYGLAGSTKAWPSTRDKRRTLKKLWQEFAVPPWERGLVPCLCVDGNLAAAIGYWVDKDWCATTGDDTVTIKWQKCN
ncbi:MAG: tRNA lysidine(34) synthetase TilS [Psychrobium sp.]